MNMRKIVAVALLVTFALASSLQGQSAPWSTAAYQSWRQGVTASGRMGVPRIATAALPTCNASNLGMVVMDTTSSSFKACDGTTFDELGAVGGATGISFNDDVALTFGTGNDANCEYDTAQTPDAWVCSVGEDSRTLVIRQAGDTADYAIAQQTNPTLVVHSAADTGNQYWSVSHNGTNGVIDNGTGGTSFADAVFIVNDTSLNMGPTTTSGFQWRTSNTPDTLLLYTSSLSNAMVVTEVGDVATDWAHPLQTHPTIFIQSTNTSPVTQYLGISAHGLQTELFKTLTESGATSVVQIPVAAGAGTGGTITYTVFASDGTDHQTRSSVIRFSVVNKAGTETCGLSNNAGTADASISETEDGNASAISSGTLTYAITCATTPTNAVDIQINAVSSLSQTTLRAYYSVTVTGPGAPLLQ